MKSFVFASSEPPSRYTFDNEERLASDETKVSVDCPPQGDRTAVLLMLGQSNAANYAGQRFSSSHGANVLNFYGGQCYVAASPLLGSSGTNGEYWTLLGNLLIESGKFDQVIISPVTLSGSEIARWASGGDLNAAISGTITQLQQSGYRITYVLWRQGEIDYVLNTNEEAYSLDFQSMVETLRKLNVGAPIYISIASKCLEPSVPSRKYRLLCALQLICEDDHWDGSTDQAFTGGTGSRAGVAAPVAGEDEHGARAGAGRDHSSAARRRQRRRDSGPSEDDGETCLDMVETF
jgi:hypothetical protein